MYKILRISAVCGIVFPVLAFTLIFLLGSLIPGYSHVGDYISEIWRLGSELRPIALMAIAATGFVFFIFSAGLYLQISEDKLSFYNMILLTLFSISLIFLGVFPCYNTCTNNGFTLHFFFTIIASVSIGFSPLLLYFSTKNDKRWEDCRKINLVVFFMALILLLFYAFYLDNYKGLFQRLYFFVCFFWVGIISIKLFKLSRISNTIKRGK